MMALIGICKGDYKKIEVVGKQVGCFEHKKVRELMNILNKYKLYFFRNQVFGLPDPGIGDYVDQARSGVSAVGNGIRGGANAAMGGARNGMRDAKPRGQRWY